MPDSFGGGTCGSDPCPDGFLTEVDPAASGSLLYGSYDDGLRVALDNAGHVYLSGFTRSKNFGAILLGALPLQQDQQSAPTAHQHQFFVRDIFRF